MGIIYLYAGLVIFLTGVGAGFSPVGVKLGENIVGGDLKYLLIPLGMLLGFFVVAAEPAVHVLTEQVEEISGGIIKRKSIMVSLMLGMAAAIGLAMVRVLTGLGIWWFIVPGYAIAIALTFFTPEIFTAIAFDSGGVASGPLTATFMLPFAIGASSAAGGNIMADAFGLVAMVAMTPLIAIQITGLVYEAKRRRLAVAVVPEISALTPEFAPSVVADEEIIDFGEEEPVTVTSAAGENPIAVIAEEKAEENESEEPEQSDTAAETGDNTENNDKDKGDA